MRRGRMPEGVVSMATAANRPDAVPRRPVDKAADTWTEHAKVRMAERKTLMEKVRAGDKRAIKKLWEEYHCRIYREIEPREASA